MFKLVAVVLCVFSLSLYAADNNVLKVDYAISQKLNHTFANDANIEPDASDFDILNTISMSSESGIRKAVITVQNIATGGRSLNQKQILGLFADGTRLQPTEFLQRFKGDEIVSITISFGKHDFPLLEVYTRPNE